MAKLALINNVTQNAPHQAIGDIVGVLDDKHIFSEREKVAFDIVTVKGDRKDVQQKLSLQRPDESVAFLSKLTGKWSFKFPGDKDYADEKRVWKHGDKWYFLEERKKFPNTFANLTSTELSKVEATDVNDLDAEKDDVYVKTVYDLSENLKNLIEAKDLNG